MNRRIIILLIGFVCILVALGGFLPWLITRHSYCIQADFSSCEFRQVETVRNTSFNRVSIAEVNSDQLLFANYQNLLFFNKKTGAQKALTPDFSALPGSEKRKPVYVPTGVAIDCDGEVYLANYRGNDILRGKIQGEKIIFITRYSSPQSLGPENVSVDKKRDIFVSANYDGSTVTAFQISTGKQLWSTSVGQAHGVVIDQDFVYVTSLVTRDIQKLDLKTGEVILRRGGIGWDPMSDQYLWPTSVQNLDQDHLVVADAQTGYISKVRKEDLKVVKYFGGNGPSVDQFNYPYVAIRLSDGLYVSSARRAGLLRLQLDPLRAETFWYDPEFYSPVKNAVPPFGKKWEKYWDMDTGHDICFYGHTFGMGFGKIYECKTNQEFMITDIGALYSAPSYLYLLQGKQVAPDFSVFLSSSSPILYALFEPDPNLPALLLCLYVGMDSWLTDEGNLICAGQNIPLTEITEKIRERANILQKKLQSQGRLTLDDLLSDTLRSPKMTLDEKSPWKTFHNDPKAAFARSFVSLEGRKFLWRHDHDPNDLAAIRKAAETYYRNVHGLPYLRLDEYLLVGMLSGVSPRSLNMDATDFSKFDPKQDLTALTALSTSDLSDYVSANGIDDSKFYFSPPSPEVRLERVELIWYSPDEAGKRIRISGEDTNGKLTVLYEGNPDGSLMNGYAVSEISLKTTQAYPKYLFELIEGGKQKRLLLRAFTPEWERKITDPLLQFAKDVSFKKRYGAGISSLTANPVLEKADTWHCGNFSLWFARHFPLEYKEMRIQNISSPTGAIHAVVEITFSDGTVKVIDPTLGIVYDSDIRSMLDGTFDFEKGTRFSRTVSPVFNLYYGPQFFYQAKVKRIYNKNEWKEK